MRHPLLIFSLLIAAPAFSQVSLRWKLRPGEVLTYKADMRELDSNTVHMTFGNFFGKDSASHSFNFDSIFKDLQKQAANTALIVRLAEQKRGLIDITMSMNAPKASTDTSGSNEAKFKNLLQALGSGVMLRGAVNEDGTIQSFYVKNDQRNLIALLFELPGRPVGVGDSWPLDVHLISMDQNFACDTSYRKNTVTLVDLKPVDGDTLAVVRYDIAEYVSGSFASPFGNSTRTATFLRMTYKGQAEFALNRGRWISYDGLMSIQSGGFMESNTVKEMRLTAQ